jgi:hypothetical protein
LGGRMQDHTGIPSQVRGISIYVTRDGQSFKFGCPI